MEKRLVNYVNPVCLWQHFMLPTWIVTWCFPLPCPIVTFGISHIPQPRTGAHEQLKPLKVMEVCFNLKGFSTGIQLGCFFCWSSSWANFFSRVFFEPMVLPQHQAQPRSFFWKGIRTPNRKPFQMTISWIHDSFWGDSTKITPESPQNPPKSPQNHLQIFATGRSLIWNWCHNHRSHVHPITHGHTGLWSSRRNRMVVVEIFGATKIIMFFKVWKGAQNTRWWFQIFFVFTATWGNDPISLIFFRWVETTN